MVVSAGKPGYDGELLVFRHFAQRAQLVVQKPELGNQVTVTAGFEIQTAAQAHLLAQTVDRANQLDFLDREAEVFQYAARGKRIYVNVHLAHGMTILLR